MNKKELLEARITFSTNYEAVSIKNEEKGFDMCDCCGKYNNVYEGEGLLKEDHDIYNIDICHPCLASFQTGDDSDLD